MRPESGILFQLSLSHELEQFGSLHMRALIKYIGRSGIRTRHPCALGQPRYKWVILASYDTTCNSNLEKYMILT